MGTSRSARELSRKFARAAVQMQRRRHKAVDAAALTGKDIYEQEAARAGLKPRSSKLAGSTWRGFGYTIKGSSQPRAVLRSRGPAWLHDSSTRPHRIQARRSVAGFRQRQIGVAAARQVGLNAPNARRARSGKQAISYPGARHPFGTFARHPGTRGKGWSKPAKKRIREKVPERYQSEFHRAIVDVFN